MSGPTSEFWWYFSAGTALTLIFGVGVIGLLFVNERTKLRLQQEKLLAVEGSERKYGNLFNAVSDLVYVHSLEGIILNVNAVARTVFGYPAADLIGTSVTDYLPPRARRGFTKYLREVVRAERDVSGVIHLRTRDRSTIIVMEFRSTLLREPGRPAEITGIARNISDRSTYERALRLSNRTTERLLRQSERMQDRLAQLSRQILQVQEDDRQRIGRELHDEIGQLLVATTANLEMIRKGLDGPRAFVSDRIEEAERLTRDLIGKVRQVIQDLLPDSLEQLGMIPTLRSYIRAFSERTALPIHFMENKQLECFGRQQKVAIYRVLQESLTNIVKHAHATNAVIETATADAAFLVQVHDNGCGFNLSGLNGSGSSGASHLGILGMQERMKIAGGTLRIRSSPGAGTTVEMCFPVAEAVNSSSESRRA